MKDLVNFKSSDFQFGRNLDKKILDARINIKFNTRTRVSFKEYEVGIRDLPTDVRKAVNKVTDIVIDELGAVLDQAMMAAIWDWTDGKRDIIDTGKLMASRSITKVGNGFTVKYDQPYAGIVHYGGYIQPYGNPKAEKFYYPPRPWVEEVLNGGGRVTQFDFESAFERAFQEVTDKYT
jgi:hypothetical protein